MLMAVAHVAHDCQLGNHVIVANNVVMGGHVSIGDHAVVGGAAAIHQFVRIGRAAMIGGVSGVEGDVIPFGSVIGNRARLAALNVIGLRRRGFDKAAIQRLHIAFKALYCKRRRVRAAAGGDPREVRRRSAGRRGAGVHRRAQPSRADPGRVGFGHSEVEQFRTEVPTSGWSIPSAREPDGSPASGPENVRDAALVGPAS